jgi:hypothetical protein
LLQTYSRRRHQASQQQPRKHNHGSSPSQMPSSETPSNKTEALQYNLRHVFVFACLTIYYRSPICFILFLDNNSLLTFNSNRSNNNSPSFTRTPSFIKLVCRTTTILDSSLDPITTITIIINTNQVSSNIRNNWISSTIARSLARQHRRRFLERVKT